MELSPNEYLLIYGAVVILVVLSLVAIRKTPRAPVKLDLNAKDTQGALPSPGLNKERGIIPPGWKTYTPRPRRNFDPEAHRQTRNEQSRTEASRNDPSRTDPSRSHQSQGGAASSDSSASSSASSSEKSLNVMFNWNGHSWDAYEVLGVPAGSSRDAVTVAFRRACAAADSQSLPFLRAAYDAICKPS